MTMAKSPEQLRDDIARVFYDQTPARPHYGLEEAVALVASFNDLPNVMDECFGGALHGGMYRNELVRCVTDSFKNAQHVLAVLRKEPDAALDLLTRSDISQPPLGVRAPP